MGRPLTGQEFEELYRATVHDLIAYLRRRGAADAENDVAEVYAIAWRRRVDLPAPMMRRAWLFGTAQKVLQANHRRQAREGSAAAELAHRPDDSPVADQDSLTTATVAAAMARLPSGDREILRLVEWERVTTAELATALGVRPATARVRLHRARKALAGDPAVRALVDRPDPDERYLGSTSQVSPRSSEVYAEASRQLRAYSRPPAVRTDQPSTSPPTSGSASGSQAPPSSGTA
ncbi:sigma-70 family RNA polymerase sigma factor [Nocardioides sp. W7]|uniref:RNA polymerase sigma factor n=1 Tax=Nocardioides sp. W7 TaxID=2931390 RepID=UPI001FD44D82|nr:sigma-70 family RNA polymerase sigma factor [Nocardioides sp. W7]